MSPLVGVEATMVEIEVRVIDNDNAADRLARRLVADAVDLRGVVDASLLRRPGAPEERGLGSEIGALVVVLTTGGAAQAVMDLVKSVLHPGGDREIVVKLPNGTEFALKGGGVSEAQFGKATDALLALLAKGDGGEAT
jgi:Effector Associated Constant Component 1